MAVVMGDLRIMRVGWGLPASQIVAGPDTEAHWEELVSAQAGLGPRYIVSETQDDQLNVGRRLARVTG